MLHVPHCVPWLFIVVVKIATMCFDCGWLPSVMPVIKSLDVVAIMDVMDVSMMHNC